MRCYQQVENRCFDRDALPGRIYPGYTISLCRRISSSVSGIQAGTSMAAFTGQPAGFTVPDRGLFDVYRGGDNDAVRAAFHGPPRRVRVSNRITGWRPLPRSGFSPARQSAGFPARGRSSAGYAPAGTGS